MKDSVNVGSYLDFEIGVPPIASATTNITERIPVCPTQSVTKQETQDWEIDRNVIVPPHTRVDMTWAIKKKKIEATFTVDVIITNSVWVTFKDKVNPNNGNQWLRNWLMPIDYTFRSMEVIGVVYPSQYTWTYGSVIYKASGVCTAAVGLATTFSIEQTPLKGGDPSIHYEDNIVPAIL